MPGVAAACIALQDEAGADVNLVLLAAWAGASRGRAVTAVDFAEAPGKQWHEEIIRPLRALRRTAKSHTGPIADPAVEALYHQLLACELGAERIRQAELHRWADPRFPAQPPRLGLAPRRGLAHDNLVATLGGTHLIASAMTTIALAAEVRCIA
ncbi:TIGR02444 family protein [Oleomonas cavernae]|uniref:TIGR02444 family protein n=2 Tax=Oleomonas cavernae TaxID=2320859 RepID=A0A418WIP7_9PROT|nr:TIGR02444 family protein [Oleomonas cavernae]